MAPLDGRLPVLLLRYVNMHPSQLSIRDFTYALPENRIAQHPLAQRDAARLLTYRNGEMADRLFQELADVLPPDTLLLFNNTRVVRARLLFPKESGATIELFCLEPLAPARELEQAMLQSGSASWLCLIGNNRRWKAGPLVLEAGGIRLVAERGERMEDAYEIHFNWSPATLSFAELLEQLGHIPLPPYMKRPDDATDASRYQTVFARFDGSVAAPTASLHFTEALLGKLDKAGIQRQELTLHIGAGTFKPVKAEQLGDHPMHREEMILDAGLIDRLLRHKGPVVPVGTTALRCLESIYWLGALLLQQPEKPDLPEVSQFTPYDLISPPETTAALLALKERLHQRTPAFTSVMIAPGYHFRLASGLITNFHQPNSTLLLLVAAALGDDWRRLYDHALATDYRFLSYGDGSLLWFEKEVKA